MLVKFKHILFHNKKWDWAKVIHYDCPLPRRMFVVIAYHGIFNFIFILDRILLYLYDKIIAMIKITSRREYKLN